MIAVDTSSWSAYLAGDAGTDVAALEGALVRGDVVLPPAVLTELLSSPRLRVGQAATFASLPALPIAPGYWERTGRLRASVLRRGHKSRLADALIAQSCIDHAVPLLTRDRDFRHYLPAGLRLA